MRLRAQTKHQRLTGKANKIKLNSVKHRSLKIPNGVSAGLQQARYDK